MTDYDPKVWADNFLRRAAEAGIEPMKFETERPKLGQGARRAAKLRKIVPTLVDPTPENFALLKEYLEMMLRSNKSLAWRRDYLLRECQELKRNIWRLQDENREFRRANKMWANKYEPNGERDM